LSATVCKMGFIMAESGMSSWFVPAGIAAGICCSASGFFCQTRGLKDGRAVVVSTCAAVASIVIGVLMGLFALGESLPGSSFGRYLLLLAWYNPQKSPPTHCPVCHSSFSTNFYLSVHILTLECTALLTICKRDTS
jgi:hypothetical protein